MGYNGIHPSHDDVLLNKFMREQEEDEARAIAIAEYIEAGMEQAILDYIKDDGEFTIINALNEAKDGDADLAKIAQFFKSYVKLGKLHTPEYAVIGEALCKMAYRFYEAECRAQLEKDSGL